MAGCSYCGKMHAPLLICDERRQALAKSHELDPVVHAVVHKPKTGETRYQDPEARRAYRRKWMAERRAGAK
jgi:hypothetical protein